MMGRKENGGSEYCTACFDGKYPVAVEDKEPDYRQLDLFAAKK